MKRLFIHHPLFRLLSPLFSGIIVYLLILLINNDVGHLQEQFLGEELYVCIGLSFIIQELSRLLLIIFNKLPKRISSVIALFIQVFISLLACVVVVTLSMFMYYKYVVGYSPNSEELWKFNIIFCIITLIYILLHISHQYLYKVNTKKLTDELLRKQMIEEEFIQFKDGINPDLLFDSFEALIVLIRNRKEEVDDFIDHIAATYRYILSKKDRQLVLIDEELKVLNQFVSLINYLPFRNVEIQNTIISKFLFVPGSLLKLVELIVRSTISSSEIPLKLEFLETESTMTIKYHHNDTITKSFSMKDIEVIEQIYSIYSTSKISVQENEQTRLITLPKLNTKS